MTYVRTVNGLTFKLFEVFGDYLPSVEMIEDILRDRRTDKSQQQFCEMSNYYCSIFAIECLNELPSDIPGNKLEIEKIWIVRNLIGNTQTMSIMTGFNFEQLVRYQYVMSWYQAVAGNFSGGNPQSIRKGKNPHNVNKKTGEMEISKLAIYLQYRKAVDYWVSFYGTISTLCRAGNTEMMNLAASRSRLFTAMAGVEEKIRINGLKIFHFYCQYCRNYFNFDSFKVRETCGSSKCKRAADAERKISKGRKT